jgi:hypothetical protein
MTTFTIPLAGYPETFSIALNNIYYTMTVQWRDVWTLDISDNSGNLIIGGIPFVMGVDLLAQYGYLGIGGALYIVSNTGLDIPPSFENLATDYTLTYVT